MKSKFRLILSLAAAACVLCGCGSVFDTEYVEESDYEPAAFNTVLEDGDATVHTLDELEQLLLHTVMSGDSGRRIVFAPTYEGDVSADIANACWQIRTQDALCAYCVENIAYDLSKIVNHYEAIVTVAYTEAAGDLDKVVHLNYAAEAEDVLRTAIEQGDTSLVLLIDRSSATEEAMEAIASQIYRENPAIAPREPHAHVDVIVGAESQRLYEISFNYGMDNVHLVNRREALAALDPFGELEDSDMSEGERALLACRYLTEHCRYTENTDKNTIYAALIEGSANSEGMAFAYVDLCHRLGLDCQIVYGQYNREDHSWTIVKLDGEYYHVDPSVCVLLDLEAGFLLNDEEAWGVYRWDYFSYPHCVGPLTYQSILEGPTEEHEGELDEENSVEESVEPDAESADEIENNS